MSDSASDLIERAARAVHDAMRGTITWEERSEGSKGVFREDAKTVIHAIAPGLLTDPPAAWIAPWDVPENARVSHGMWVAARDAYLKEQSGKP